MTKTSDILFINSVISTPHVQCERDKVIGVGVQIYIMFVDKKIFESYFSDPLTFSNFAVALLVKFID